MFKQIIFYLSLGDIVLLCMLISDILYILSKHIVKIRLEVCFLYMPEIPNLL